MLIRLRSPLDTPIDLATTTVDGGLLFYRSGRVNRVVGVTTYKRSLPERPYRRRPMFKRRKPYRRARRTLRLGRAPQLTYWTPTWKTILGLQAVPAPQRAVLVGRLGRRRFTKWAARVIQRRGRYKPGLPWAWHPHHQQDPIRYLWGWHHRVQKSRLCGRHFWTSRSDQLQYRLRGLLRRERHYRHLRQLAEVGKQFTKYYFHRRRRKLPLNERRYHLFRRRRLRGYHRRGHTTRGYLRGCTRQVFHRGCDQRYVRLEQVAALGSSQPYYNGVARWTIHTWGARVGTPWEYNYYRPSRGYHRFEKKRRPDARRWKLGQHPVWAVGFQEARQIRWDWFGTTNAAGTPIPTLSTPPVTTGLVSSLYWSAQPWGRGRWPRPDKRAAHVFVSSWKTGYTVEAEATQWGSTGTSATGVLHSHALENELREAPLDLVLEPQTLVLPTRGSPWPLRFRLWGVIILGWLWWWVVTPVWWVWSIVCTGWCLVGGTAWWVICWVRSVYASFSVGVYTLFMVELTYPFTTWLTHWVKERPFVKTGAWLYTSWLLAYNIDDDQQELETFTYADEANNIINEEEVDPNDQYVSPDDSLDPGARDVMPSSGDPSWLYDLGSFIEDWRDSLFDWATEEVPHHAGLFCRPLVDWAVRLPIWAVAEGMSTLALWCKLEWQHRWYTMLTYGNVDGRVRGRWWKVPVVMVAMLFRIALVVVTAWLIFCQVDYSAFRVGLTYSWGLPWREEYYAAWFFVSGAAAIYLVGPVSWKNYLFQELGVDNLFGTYIVAAQFASEEDYYPARPPGLAERVATAPHLHKPHPMEMVFHINSAGWWDTPNYSGYDRVRLRLAQYYGYQNYGYDVETDLEDFYILPAIHQPISYRNLDLYPDETQNSINYRAFRDTFGHRNNYYRLYNTTPDAHRGLVQRRAPLIRQQRVTILPDEQEF